MNSNKNTKDSYNKVISKGKSIIIGERTIYPIIMVSTYEVADKYFYESITPLALAVIEPEQKYFVALDEENVKIRELLSEEGLWDELEIEY